MSVSWLAGTVYEHRLDTDARAAIAHLKPQHVPKGSILFRPGDKPSGFVMVLNGTIGVYLTGRGGREILLYEVTPGETCVQTTVGLLGEQAYGGEAVAETDCVAVMIPIDTFRELMDTSNAFRGFVFRAFGERLSEVTSLLERVAFERIEARLARALLERSDRDGIISLTHQELAAIIGSAREVVSRRLENFRSKDLVELTRGEIRLVDEAALGEIANRDDS